MGTEIEGLTREDFKIMDDFNRFMFSEAKKEERKANRYMKAVKPLLTRKKYQCLRSEIEESGHAYNFHIVKEPPAFSEKQSLDAMPRTFIWIHQVQHFEDSYTGEIAFPIKPGRWLQWSFSM